MSAPQATDTRSGRSELWVSAFLAAVAAVVLVDASRIGSGLADQGPVGPKAVPVAVAVLLLGCAAVLAVDVLRGNRGEAEAGEDIDLAGGSDWRTVLLLAGVFLANVALIDTAGYVISMSLLFLGSVWALGSRHLVRDLAISVLLSLGTFYGFYVGLGIHLPPGILKGIL